jgi:uncharacterized integral membrane protein
MRNTRLALAFVLAVVIVVIALQNTEPVDTKLLFATVSMPRAVLIFTTAASGFGLGVLTTLVWTRSGRRGGGS